MPLTSQEYERLTRLLGMFGSDFDGEVLNAARAAQKLVKSKGETWETVLRTASTQSYTNGHEQRRPKESTNEYKGAPHASEVDACMGRANFCTPWEREFLVSIKDRWSLSEKQRGILDRIKEKLKAYEGMDF
jgi:hypothetical protein